MESVAFPNQIMSIWKAAKLLLSAKILPENLWIFSDSQTAVKCYIDVCHECRDFLSEIRNEE